MSKRESNLERWRTREGLFVGLARLAKEAGVDTATVWRAQNGRGSVATFERLASATERLRPGQGLTIGQIIGMEPYEADEAAPTARAAQM